MSEKPSPLNWALRPGKVPGRSASRLSRVAMPAMA
jgi:hypothetical protein